MQDVLLELITRLDDDTLLKMSSSPYWREQIRALLSSEIAALDFWYRKTKNLVKADIDSETGVASVCDSECWKDVYYSVKIRKQMEDEAIETWNPIRWESLLSPTPIPDKERMMSALGLNSVEAFRVVSKLYRVPVGLSRVVKSKLWTMIRDPRVLAAAIQARLTNAGDYFVGDALRVALRDGDKELLYLLVSLFSTPERHSSSVLTSEPRN